MASEHYLFYTPPELDTDESNVDYSMKCIEGGKKYLLNRDKTFKKITCSLDGKEVTQDTICPAIDKACTIYQDMVLQIKKREKNS